MGSQPPPRQCRHRAEAAGCGGKRWWGLTEGTGTGTCRGELMQSAPLQEHWGKCQPSRYPVTCCNIRTVGTQLRRRKEGPLVVLLPFLLGAEHPLPSSRRKSLQSMSWCERGKGGTRRTCLCCLTPGHRPSSPFSRCQLTASTTNTWCPANPALEQSRVGVSSLPAPDEWLLPGSQMQQRLEMASAPPGASDRC